MLAGIRTVELRKVYTHRARHGARSAGAVSGRAQRRSRPADALAPVGDRSRVQPDRQNHSAHHAQHGRSRHALPAPCHHRPRPGDRPGNSSRIEGFRPRRFSPAVAVRPALGGVSRAPAKAFRGSRSARHRRRRTARCAYLRAEPRESLSAPYGKELARMNWKTFLAILARDAHVARRNVVALLFQTFLQPLMFVFIFGRVMVGSGYMPPSYKSLLLPGIMAICMVGTGIWAVAMPVIAEFQFTHEIEDRLLAPMDISWLAVEKVVAGTLQSLAAGLMVIPAAWLLLRPGVDLRVPHALLFAAVALLVALFSATGGLALGCSMQQTHIGLMFSLIVAPMIFFGCTYYPWSALEKFPIMQKAVLVNPLVYASEGLRATLVPQFPHLPLLVVLAVLVIFNLLLFTAGLRWFYGKAVS